MAARKVQSPSLCSHVLSLQAAKVMAVELKIDLLEAAFRGCFNWIFLAVDLNAPRNHDEIFNHVVFVWTATADSIFAKIQRLCERISGTAH